MIRKAKIERATAETRITVSLALDGEGAIQGQTGIGFFDHMLAHVVKHGRLDLRLEATGDLHVDDHHLIEDVGLCLGRALNEALGDRRGIERFGAGFVAMDDALARTVIDLSGRSYLAFQAAFSREQINGFSLETVKEFFRAVATEGRLNLHITLLYGDNAHHQVEAIFKSFGRALREAVRLSGGSGVPSTKGIL
jgi:imidazoleglycerol-phosphate dehydratase